MINSLNLDEIFYVKQIYKIFFFFNTNVQWKKNERAKMFVTLFIRHKRDMNILEVKAERLKQVNTNYYSFMYIKSQNLPAGDLL